MKSSEGVLFGLSYLSAFHALLSYTDNICW